MVTAEESAVAWGVTQATAWLSGRFDYELNGRQRQEIATRVAEILIPYLKVAMLTEIADGLRATEEIDRVMVTFDDLADGYEQTAAAYLDELKGGRG